MQIIASDDPPKRGPAINRRAVAIANARWFRAVAWRALRDRAPQGELRAANARKAACIVLRQWQQDAFIDRLLADALAGSR